MYAEVDYELTAVAKERLFGGSPSMARDFRKLVAKRLAQIESPIAEAAMNYQHGRPADGPAPLRFAGYRGGVRLIGLGRLGCEIIREVAPHALRALSQQSQTVITARTRTGDCSIRLSDSVRTYGINTMVIGSHRHRHWWRDLQDRCATAGTSLLDEPVARTEIERFIKASIVRQAIELHEKHGDVVVHGFKGAPLSASLLDDVLKVSALHYVDTITVPVSGALSRQYTESQGKKAPGALALKGLDFECNAIIKGRWSVGMQQSRGNGAVIALRGEA